MTMAMGGEEAAPMLPKPGPNPFLVRFGNVQFRELVAAEELKTPFAMRRRQCGKPGPNLEKKHDPMGLALVTMFAHQAGQMQIRWPQHNPQFFARFTAATGVGGFSHISVEFAAAGAPEATVGF